MRSYKQLGQAQRYQIYAYRKVGKSHSEIAQEIGVDPAMISRELRRNQGEPGYRPHQKALARRQNASKSIKMTTEVIDWIEEKLCQDWSPEQISGPMKHRGSFSISHEHIYQHIWSDKHLGGTSG